MALTEGSHSTRTPLLCQQRSRIRAKKDFVTFYGARHGFELMVVVFVQEGEMRRSRNDELSEVKWGCAMPFIGSHSKRMDDLTCKSIELTSNKYLNILDNTSNTRYN